MNRSAFLTVTAVIEAATGVGLLVLPAVVFGLLLGESAAAPDTVLVGRIAGAALLALGFACWPGRRDGAEPVRPGLLTGLLVYNVAVTALLVDAGAGPGRVGVLLWPAVGVHTALAGWGLANLLFKSQTSHPRGG